MTRHIVMLAGLLLCLGSLTSCLKDNDHVELSHDCYISNVTLGSMRRAHHVTTTQGKDSVYYTTYSGNNYHMSIDQLKGTISNTDSLLYNTVLGKSLITIKGSGNIVYRPENQLEEQWTTFSANDSIDISSPVLLRVFSPDGTSKRDYRMVLHVRKQDPNGFSWDTCAVAPFADLDRVKAVWTGEHLVVAAAKNGTAKCYHSTANAQEWSMVCDNIADGAEVETLTLAGGKLWMSTSDGHLVCSEDKGMSWLEADAPAGLRLLCGNDTVLYALCGGQMMSARGDMQWTADNCDAPDMLPTAGAIGICYAMETGGGRAIVVGQHNDDAVATVWGRTLHPGYGGDWIHYVLSANNCNPCPAMTGMSLTRYNRELVAIGGDLKAAYISPDNGITWKANYTWTLPEMDATQATAITADDKGRLWLINGTTVCSGRAHTLKD